MTRLNELAELIRQWGKEKGIVSTDNFGKQYLKFIEEVGELAGAILKEKDENYMPIWLEIGDVAVTHILKEACSGYDVDIEDLRDNKDPKEYGAALFISYLISESEHSKFQILHYIAQIYDSTLEQCLELTYAKISKRTGSTVNGVFIKD